MIFAASMLKSLVINKYTIIGTVIICIAIGAYFKGRTDMQHKYQRKALKEVVSYACEMDRITNTYKSMPVNAARMLSGQVSSHYRGEIPTNATNKDK